MPCRHYRDTTTQLLSLVLAARYRKPIPIVLGVLAATLINHAASGALGAWLASILSPGILNWAENYDVAGLIAPRPLFSEGGNRDPIFPFGATRESYARVKKVYEVFAAGSCL